TICLKGEDDVSSDGYRSTETNVTNSTVIVSEDECNSSSSSSIGDDSDADPEDDVESRYGYGYDRKNDNDDDNNNNNNNKNRFDDAIEALEQALPIRRGISTFYNGKSKSFTCLANVWPTMSSVQDIAKPENAYTRKRRNLGAFKLSNINIKRICKKPKTSRVNFTIEREDKNFTTHATRPQINRPLALRSFSMVQLH
ncbi:hypothetical protein M8C21_020564, partial [Ambrosia artemisiifolia]